MPPSGRAMIQGSAYQAAVMDAPAVMPTQVLLVIMAKTVKIAIGPPQAIFHGPDARCAFCVLNVDLGHVAEVHRPRAVKELPDHRDDGAGAHEFRGAGGAVDLERRVLREHGGESRPVL